MPMSHFPSFDIHQLVNSAAKHLETAPVRIDSLSNMVDACNALSQFCKSSYTEYRLNANCHLA